MPKIHRVLETCLYVDDLEVAESFYQTILGLSFYSKQAGRHVFFRCGDQMVLCFDPSASSDPSASFPPHGARGAGHVAFAVDEGDIRVWQEWLSQHGIAIEKTIRWPGGGTSLYFRDPSGNSLELASPTIWAFT